MREKVVRGPRVRQLARDRASGQGQERRRARNLARLQVRESSPKIVLRQVGDRGQEREPYVLADDGSALEQALFRGRQAIDASGDDNVDRGRNLDDRLVPCQPMRPLAADQGSGFDECSYALLQEERIALRPLDQGPLEGLKRGVVAKTSVQEFLGGLGG